MTRRNIDQEARRLARATESLAASPGFTDAVLGRVLALELGMWSTLPRLGRRVTLGFAAAALLALGCAAALSGSVDQALASNFNQVELEW